MSAGYLEGVVRGYKGGLLTQAQYNNLTQCENLEGESRGGVRVLSRLIMNSWVDFRLQLSATDYGNFLANEPLPLSTATIGDKVRSVFCSERTGADRFVGNGETCCRVQLYQNKRRRTAGDFHGLHNVSPPFLTRNAC